MDLWHVCQNRKLYLILISLTICEIQHIYIIEKYAKRKILKIQRLKEFLLRCELNSTFLSSRTKNLFLAEPGHHPHLEGREPGAVALSLGHLLLRQKSLLWVLVHTWQLRTIYNSTCRGSDGLHVSMDNRHTLVQRHSSRQMLIHLKNISQGTT